MGPSRTTSARAKPRGHATGRVIPQQGRRIGQTDLRRVTITPSTSANAGRETEASTVVQPSRAVPVSTPAWLTNYRRRLMGTDGLIVVVSVLLGQFIGTGLGAGFGDWLLSGLLVAAWLISLGIEGVWNIGVLGNGPAEYRRIITASFVLGAVVGIATYLTPALVVHQYLLISVPLGMVGLIVGHGSWRKWLGRHQRSGRHLRTVVIVGHPAEAEALADLVRERSQSGFSVIAVCDVDDVAPGYSDRAPGIPVFRNGPEVAARAIELGAGAVAVAGTGFAAERLSELWACLQGTGVQLFVEPDAEHSVSMHLHPVAGLPLTRVGEPRFSGWQAAVKRTLDVSVAMLGLLLLSPFILIAAGAVLLADGVPIFHDQELVGRGGRPFRAWTLRCTPQGVKARLVQIDNSVVVPARTSPDVVVSKSERPGRLGGQFSAPAGPGGSAEVGFERPVGWDEAHVPVAVAPCPPTANDLLSFALEAPTVYELEATKVGRVLRRVGIDEAPLLLSVLLGRMSLVGPPAGLPGSDEATLRVRPGLTGSWRLGRTLDRTAQDRAREDYDYVGTWCVLGDLTTMAKTVKLVLSGADRRH